jgi:hypothetical protein
VVKSRQSTPPKAEKLKNERQATEAVANSPAGVVVVAFRECWHSRMSWPIPYQVCLSCGSKWLFNEETFSACGRSRYDLNELISSEKSAKSEPRRLECMGKENICRSAQ